MVNITTKHTSYLGHPLRFHVLKSLLLKSLLLKSLLLITVEVLVVALLGIWHIDALLRPLAAEPYVVGAGNIGQLDLHTFALRIVEVVLVVGGV